MVQSDGKLVLKALRGSKVMPYYFSGVFVMVLVFSSSLTVASSEIQIPRSVSGDKGKYFLLEHKRSGTIVRTTHKRVGVGSVGYNITETNCKTMQMRELGYSEHSPSAIKHNPSGWFDLVAGSSKSDVAKFVCRR